MSAPDSDARRGNPVWAELLQLLPVVTLALPFILSGEVDLERAGPAFVVAAVLTVPVTGAVLARRHLLNPIAVGTALWLGLGAVALGTGVEPLATWVADTQAFALFACALAVGGIATVASPHGYIGARRDPAWIRKASLVLLALTAGAVVWAWAFRHDIRLGGGLPFIVLNVARRLAIARA